MLYLFQVQKHLHRNPIFFLFPTNLWLCIQFKQTAGNTKHDPMYSLFVDGNENYYPPRCHSASLYAHHFVCLSLRCRASLNRTERFAFLVYYKTNLYALTTSIESRSMRTLLDYDDTWLGCVDLLVRVFVHHI